MVKKIKILVIMLFIFLISFVYIYADSTTAWNSYSLYNLNNTAIEIASENRSCTVYGSRVSSVTSYSIKNSSTSDLNAILGFPVNVIDGVTVSDSGKYLKLKVKSLQNIRNSYNIDGQLPQSDEWYYFNLGLKAGESRTIQVKTEEILQKDNSDVYNLVFYKDLNNSRVLSGKTVQFKAAFTDYKPYNIVDVNGLEDNDIDNSGNISFSLNGDAVAGFTIKYQPIEKMMLDKLSQSVYKKPKAIAKAFRSRDYQTALNLCNEYIGFPQDKKLNTDQVKLVKAECLRKQNKNLEYIDIINGLNTTSLYPARIKYKILFDKLIIYKAENRESEYKQLLTQINNDTKLNYEFLNSWLQNNNYVLATDSNTKPAETNTATAGTDKKVSSSSKIGWLTTFSAKMVKLTKGVRTDLIIAIIVSFILGFLLGRRGGGGRRRRGGSVYLFRN